MPALRFNSAERLRQARSSNIAAPASAGHLMTIHQRVLLLGITGINKKPIAELFRVEAKRIGHEYQVIDFDREFLPKAQGFRSHQSYSAKPIIEQAAIWNEAWEKFKAAGIPEKAILL